MRACNVAENFCESTNLICFACGLAVCAECSAIRRWVSYRMTQGGWKQRKHRICNNCWEEEQEWKAKREQLRHQRT